MSQSAPIIFKKIHADSKDSLYGKSSARIARRFSDIPKAVDNRVLNQKASISYSKWYSPQIPRFIFIRIIALQTSYNPESLSTRHPPPPANFPSYSYQLYRLTLSLKVIWINNDLRTTKEDRYGREEQRERLNDGKLRWKTRLNSVHFQIWNKTINFNSYRKKGSEW